MTEEEWFSADNADTMLRFIAEKECGRRLRLFGAAACRRVWHLLTDQRAKQAIETAEGFADGVADRKQLKRAKKNADDVVLARIFGTRSLSAARAVSELAERGKQFDRFRAIQVAIIAAEALDDPQAASITTAGITTAEMRFQARLVRHIFGNPFRPYPKPASWSSTVVQLAESLYQGNNDCRLPLSDALEESGHVELADHFRKDEWHPKGCWVVDLVLGKE